MSTFTKRVLASADDGYKDPRFSPAWDYTANTITTGYSSFPGADDFTSAVRFNSVIIAKGATITSAKITFKSANSDSNNVLTKVYGIDEDDTADFSSDPTARTKTSASADWDVNGTTSGNTYDATGLASIVQEIIDRGSWSSGNDMGFLIVNDGSTDGISHSWDSWDGDSTSAALLTVEYTTTGSASESPSSSSSLSPSASLSSSASLSASASVSVSDSPSPSPVQPFFGLKIAKDGKDVLTAQKVTDFKFNSDYGTLKYFSKETAQIQFDANDSIIAGTATISHDLGYYPFVEVFVKNAATGQYEYCPFSGSGATVTYGANYKITTSDIVLYAEIIGMSVSVWTFNFLVFIYKNNLNL